MTQTIATDSAEFPTLPRTIRDLITETIEIGGEVTQEAERLFTFALPVKVVGGARRLVNRSTVGYYVRDGKNIIRGVYDTRQEIAYWARQSR